MLSKFAGQSSLWSAYQKEYSQLQRQQKSDRRRGDAIQREGMEEWLVDLLSIFSPRFRTSDQAFTKTGQTSDSATVEYDSDSHATPSGEKISCFAI